MMTIHQPGVSATGFAKGWWSILPPRPATPLDSPGSLSHPRRGRELGDVGRAFPIWYSPMMNDVTTEPQEFLSTIIASVWSTVIGFTGLLSIHALFVRLRDRRAIPTGDPVVSRSL